MTFTIAALTALSVATAFADEPGRRPRLAVIPFTSGEGVSNGQAQSIAGFVRDEFVEAGSYELIDRTLLKERLDERDLADAGVTNLTLEGKELGVEKIVGGHVAFLDGNWSIDVRIVDVATGNTDESTSASADTAGRCEVVTRNLVREMLKKALYADEVRNQQELMRRKNLEAMWIRQKAKLKVSYRPVSEKRRKGRFYEIKIVNPLSELVKDVVIQLQSKDGGEIKSETVKFVRPNKSTSREIRWTARGKPAKCVITSVGGDFSRPTCKSCKGKGFKNCTACMTKGSRKCGKCGGKGTLRKPYKVKEGEFERTLMREVDCRQCGGKGTMKCTVCRGLGRSACNKCRATGFAE